MAWNRPTDDGRAVSTKPPLRRGYRPRPTVRGAITGGIVVLGTAIAAWWLWSGDESAGERPPPHSARQIKEVKPSSAPQVAEKPKDPPGYWNGKKISDDNRPPWMSPYHRVIDYGVVHTVKVDTASLPLYERVFDNGCDQQIASLLLVEPGTYVLGSGKGLYDGFDADFIESLKEPIIVSADDTDEVKELKKAVRAVKIDLKQRFDNGENLQAIMESSWQSMKELGLYRLELQEQVEKIADERDDLTDADVDDCIAAANMMLEDRGCGPMRAPEFLKEKIMLKVRGRRMNGESGNKECDNE